MHADINFTSHVARDFNEGRLSLQASGASLLMGFRGAAPRMQGSGVQPPAGGKGGGPPQKIFGKKRTI